MARSLHYLRPMLRASTALLALLLGLAPALEAQARFAYRSPARARACEPRASACKVVGLTGGIASGKSTVSRMFRQLGAKIVDADTIARRIVKPGKPALAEIARTFGPEMIRPDGTLDRARLGRTVFSDPAKLARLDSITHPRIAASARRSINRYRRLGAPLVVYDAALIVEQGWHRGLDGLVVVSVPERVQLQRLQQRDGMSTEQALQRIRSQLPLAAKVKVADHVVDNGGTLDRTRQQVERLYRQLTAER